jgi:hypothetical protein
MRRALEIDEKSYGPEHPKVAIRLNNLAQLLNPDFSPVVWKKAVPRGIICSGSTGYADIRGRPYEHRV